MICITNINKNKLKTGLKTTEKLKNTWLINYIEPIIFVSANLKFVHFRINLMSKDNSKIKAKKLFVYKNSIFFFIYNIKTTD